MEEFLLFCQFPDLIIEIIEQARKGLQTGLSFLAMRGFFLVHMKESNNYN